MAKETTESHQEQPEGQVAQPDTSTATGEKPTSQAAQADSQFVTVEQFEKFQKSFQSRKDKGIANVEKEVKTLKDQIAEFNSLKEKFGDDDLAYEFMQMRQKVYGEEEPAPTQEPQGSGDEWGAALDGIFEKTGLDKNDPEVLKLAQTHGTGATFAAELTALGIQRATQPPPSQGSITTPSGGGAMPSGDYPNDTDEQLGTKLTALQNEPTKNKAEIAKITAELERRAPQQKIM